ncbi:hypothetical protein ABK040_004742 [Willaertia magna]
MFSSSFRTVPMNNNMSINPIQFIIDESIRITSKTNNLKQNNCCEEDTEMFGNFSSSPVSAIEEEGLPVSLISKQVFQYYAKTHHVEEGSNILSFQDFDIFLHDLKRFLSDKGLGQDLLRVVDLNNNYTSNGIGAWHEKEEDEDCDMMNSRKRETIELDLSVVYEEFNTLGYLSEATFLDWFQHVLTVFVLFDASLVNFH